MRFLFTTLPGLGHFFPIVPLAWAARATGHDVLVATTSRALEASERAGLPAIDVAPGIDVMEFFRARQEKAGGAFAFSRDVFSDATLTAVAEVFGEISDKMADRTVEAARSWQPDVVVHTPIGGAGPLAASLLSVPAVLHGFGLGPGAGLNELVDRVFRTMRPAFERHGLSGGPAPPLVVLDPTPPSMQGDDRPPAWPVRYVAYNGGGALPDWIVQPPFGPASA